MFQNMTMIHYRSSSFACHLTKCTT